MAYKLRSVGIWCLAVLANVIYEHNTIMLIQNEIEFQLTFNGHISNKCLRLWVLFMDNLDFNDKQY